MNVFWERGSGTVSEVRERLWRGTRAPKSPPGEVPARLAILCAEIVPWRCHRRIVADHLVAAGARVRHILGPGEVEDHVLDSMARTREDGRVVYPPETPPQGELFGEG